MPFFMIILVSLVQGITEFLPVSSSGHLVLLPILTDQPYQGRTIDVAAHVGTLFAVMFFLRVEITRIVIGIGSFGRHNKSDARLGLMLIAATIPVIVAGFYVNYANWNWLTAIETLAWSNLIFAGLLWGADRYGVTVNNMKTMRFSSAIFIYFFDAILGYLSLSFVSSSLYFFNKFKKIPQVLENIEVKDKSIIKDLEVKKSIKLAEKLMNGQGRILVRESGTETKIRVMGESENKKLLIKCMNIILKKIK